MSALAETPSLNKIRVAAPPGPASSASATSDCRSPWSSRKRGLPRDRHRPRRAQGRRDQRRARPTSPTCRPRDVAGARHGRAAATPRPTSPSSRELDTINICVPTPLRKTKDPDMSYIVSAVEAIATHLHPGHAGRPRVDDLSGHDRRSWCSRCSRRAGSRPASTSSSRSRPSASIRATRRSTRTTCRRSSAASTPTCTRAGGGALRHGDRRRSCRSARTRVAEMVKLLENTFRAVNIGLVNELALMCDRMDIDVWEVVDAAKTKPFGFMPFYPGPGLGGHCIPIDPFYLSWKAKQTGFDPRFIELAGHINGGDAALRRRQGRRRAERAAQGAERLARADRSASPTSATSTTCASRRRST